MQRIIISRSDREALAKHAESEKPNESCAILLGRDEEVSEIFLARNADESPTSFAISNEQLIQGYRLAEERRLDVIGIFHSHPNSDAYPSNKDKRFMQSNPVAWIIYSGVTGDSRAYVLESEIREIPIEQG